MTTPFQPSPDPGRPSAPSHADSNDAPESQSTESTSPAPVGGVLRRTVLKAGLVTLGAIGPSLPVAAENVDQDGNAMAEDDVDSPEGFHVFPLALHAAFTDDVSARFGIRYDEGSSIVSNLPRDASNVVFAKVSFDPEGTTGWHTHPGPAVVNITEGELELKNERDCVVRKYVAGEAFVDPGQGNVHVATNPSTTDETVAYAMFLGVPEGTSPTVSVPPADC